MSKVFSENQVPVIDHIIGRYLDLDSAEESEILHLFDNVTEDTVNDKYCGYTLLQIATEKNHINVVKKLLEFENIEPNNIGCKGYPLYIALKNGHMNIFDILFVHPKINVNNNGIYNNHVNFISILEIACKLIEPNFFKFLLNDERITPNAINIYGYPLLNIISSASSPKLSFLQALIDHPLIDINKQDYHGNTPLHEICKYNRLDCLKELLKKPNLDISLRNNAGLTALDIAIENKNDTCVDLIIKYNESK